MCENFYLLSDETGETIEDLGNMEDFCLKIQLDMDDIIVLFKEKQNQNNRTTLEALIT